MKRLILLFLTLALTLTLTACGEKPAADTDRELEWNNAFIEQTVRDTLKIYDRPLTVGDAAEITTFEITNTKLTDVSSVKNLPNLEKLYLDSCRIGDISQLAGLTGLTYLDISRNGVTDLTPLSGLTKLETLIAARNDIEDWSAVEALNIEELIK